MAEPVLEIEDLVFKYPDYPGLVFPELFSGLNLRLNKGEVRVILGKPESGKTTLSRIIMALLPRYSGGSISGKIKLNGKDTAGKAPFELISEAGAVFQNPDEQIITTRCDAETAFPMESMGWPREKIADRIDYAFSCTGIGDLKHRDPSTLSGGEKKKLLLSSLFAVDPGLWILDETFEELDPASLQSILKASVSNERTILVFMTRIPPAFKEYDFKYSIIYKGTLIHREDSEDRFPELMKKEGLILDPDIHGMKENTYSGSAILELKGVSYRYGKNSPFKLDIDNFSVKRGEIVSIVGKNGSGKSTFGKLLCGLLEPDTGRIIINSAADPIAAGKDELNRLTGFIFQNPDYQIFLPTVKEELSYGLNPDSGEIEKVISLFALPKGDVPPAIMSYGARKRLQGAVYYLFDKDLYIIDEADSGLATDDFKRLISLFHSENSGVIIISHNMELCRFFSEKIYIMENGKILSISEKSSFHNVDNYFAEKYRESI